MTEVILISVIGGLILWLLKLTLVQSNFRKNHLADLSDTMGRLDERLKNVEKDVEKIWKKLDELISKP